MESRIASLEAHMEHVQASLKKLEDLPERVTRLEVKVDNLPTKDDIHKLSMGISGRLILLLGAIAGLVAYADRIQAFFH